jgi:hypothetical protein
MNNGGDGKEPEREFSTPPAHVYPPEKKPEQESLDGYKLPNEYPPMYFRAVNMDVPEEPDAKIDSGGRVAVIGALRVWLYAQTAFYCLVVLRILFGLGYAGTGYDALALCAVAVVLIAGLVLMLCGRPLGWLLFSKAAVIAFCVFGGLILVGFALWNLLPAPPLYTLLVCLPAFGTWCYMRYKMARYR